MVLGHSGHHGKLRFVLISESRYVTAQAPVPYAYAVRGTMRRARPENGEMVSY